MWAFLPKIGLCTQLLTRNPMFRSKISNSSVQRPNSRNNYLLLLLLLLLLLPLPLLWLLLLIKHSICCIWLIPRLLWLCTILLLIILEISLFSTSFFPGFTFFSTTFFTTLFGLVSLLIRLIPRLARLFKIQLIWVPS